jgi:hypothetical protein
MTSSKKKEGRWVYLQALSLLIAVFAFAIPGTALAVQCSDDNCTYYGWFGTYPGHCGPHDQDCYCFANEGGGEQPQEACISEV